LEHKPSEPTTPSTKGKRSGQRPCIGRVAQGQRAGGMCVLKLGSESVSLSSILEVVGYRK